LSYAGSWYGLNAMGMMLQLQPPIPVQTPRGPGLALVLLDYSTEFHLYWVVGLDGSGEVWTFANPDIRLRSNPTMGRTLDPTER